VLLTGLQNWSQISDLNTEDTLQHDTPSHSSATYGCGAHLCFLVLNRQ